jgi:hypothetical protein
LDAEGVTPELKLRLKFYCSWTWNFFLFVCFLVCSVSCLFVHLSTLISLVILFVYLLVLLLWIS